MEKKDRIFLISGGLFRLFDGVTDILYLSTQTFSMNFLFQMCLGFLFAPLTILAILFVVAICFQWQEAGNTLWKVNCIVAITILCGEQFGFASLVYGTVYSFKDPGREKDSVTFMCKMSGLVYALFESIPELILQTYNSGVTGNTSGIFISSCICSGLNIIFSFLRMFYTHDQVQQERRTIEMMTAAKYLSKEVWRNTDITLEQFN